MPTEPELAVAEPRPDLSRLHLVEPERRLPGRNLTKATVFFYRQGDFQIAVKSYAESPWLIRSLLGPWLIRREAAAYSAAAGIDGLPRCFGQVGPAALATEWLEAEQLAQKPKQSCSPKLFDRIATIIDDLHQRGVALADLHHRDVLVTDDGEVFLIDLATAWVLKQRHGRLRRYVFERLCDSDRVSLARMRARYTGADMEAAIAEVGPRAAAWHRRGRRFKALVDRLRGKKRK
jgi:tRNA A-37 threonylcarbamoyl transferase component Bud32